MSLFTAWKYRNDMTIFDHHDDGILMQRLKTEKQPPSQTMIKETKTKEEEVHLAEVSMCLVQSSVTDILLMVDFDSQSFVYWIAFYFTLFLFSGKCSSAHHSLPSEAWFTVHTCRSLSHPKMSILQENFTKVQLLLEI